MTSAVLDRVLAIPDYDLDLPQMGLSNNSWAIVAATGKTKDGSPAKASVLKQERKGVSQQDIKKAGEKVGIKGDRAISSEPRIVKNNANTKDLIAVKIDGKSVSVPSGSEFVAVKDNHIQSQIVGQRAYRVAPKNGTQDDYIRETVQGQYAPVVTFKTPEQALKYAEKLNRAVAKKQKESPKAVEKPANRKLTPEIATKAKSDKPATKFESKLKDEVATTAKYIKTRTNDPRLIQNAIDNTKAIVIDKLVPKIRAGNKKILNPLREKRAIGAYKGKDIIRRKKRAMSEGDISRNAGIASAKLESQGQLNLFNQPKRSAAIAPDTAKKVKRANSNSPKVVKGKSYTSTSGNQFQRIEIDGKTYDIKTRDGRKGSAMSYAEAKAKALAQHAKK